MLLADHWDAFPSLRAQLFKPNRPGYSRARTDAGEVQRIIETNEEFGAFRSLVANKLDDWWASHRATLAEIKERTAPKSVIHETSEHLLNQFADVPLLSRYGVYEQLMVYWGETMQDDVYLISAEGWVDATKPRTPLADKERKIVEDPDLVIGSGRSAKRYKMDLLPPALVVARYLAYEQKVLDELQLALDQATHELDEYVEEHGVEGGLLEDVVNDKGKVTKAGVTAQIQALRGECNCDDELAAAKRCSELLDAEAAAKKSVKEAQHELDTETLAQYSKLTEDEIKVLVIDDKWIGAVRSAILAEVQHLSATLGARVQLLERRYRNRLPELEAVVEHLASRVSFHLSQMGFRG